MNATLTNGCIIRKTHHILPVVIRHATLIFLTAISTDMWVLSAGSQGGAVYMINATSLAVEQSSFVNNTALTGGGIYMSRVTDTYIYDNYFYSNNVTQEGGGIYSGMPPFHVALHVPVLYSSPSHEVC